jgi:hypothetical protein
LETLKQNTPEGHLDYDLLTQAISELKKVASFINKGIGGEKDLGVLAYLQGLADAQGNTFVFLKRNEKRESERTLKKEEEKKKPQAN